MSLRDRNGIQHEFLIVNAERFRDGSGRECVLLECGHRYIRTMPRDKDTHLECSKEHDILGKRLPWDRDYVSMGDS